MLLYITDVLLVSLERVETLELKVKIDLLLLPYAFDDKFISRFSLNLTK